MSLSKKEYDALSPEEQIMHSAIGDYEDFLTSDYYKEQYEILQSYMEYLEKCQAARLNLESSS